MLSVMARTLLPPGAAFGRVVCCRPMLLTLTATRQPSCPHQARGPGHPDPPGPGNSGGTPHVHRKPRH